MTESRMKLPPRFAEQMQAFHLRELEETGPAWEGLLEGRLSDAPGQRVLDVGCGTGFLAVLLARNGWEVTAIDTSSAMLAQAQRTARQHGVARRIIFAQRSAESTGYADGSFDAVVSRHASWMFPDPEEGYREWYRLLGPDGVVLNMDANWLIPLWGNDASDRFFSDEAVLVAEHGEFRDLYHDAALLELLRGLPLAFRERPTWDERFLTGVGFDRVESTMLSPHEYWNSFLALRYRAMPTFAVRARRPGPAQGTGPGT